MRHLADVARLKLFPLSVGIRQNKQKEPLDGGYPLLNLVRVSDNFYSV